MPMTERVKTILGWCESDCPGTKGNLARGFAADPLAYDPHHHFQLAVDAGFSAYATPLGMIEAGVDTFLGKA